MFVISIEGAEYLNKGTWSTHKVLGAWGDKQEAKRRGLEEVKEDNVVILTDLSDGSTERIGDGS